MSEIEIGLDFPLWQPFTRMKSFLYDPVFYEKGEGIYIYDQDGDRYLDAAGGLWNVSLGLGNRKILEAVREQMETMAFGSLFHRSNVAAYRLARKLVDITGPQLTRAFLTTTGSEAVEVAIKVIRNYNSLVGETGKKGIVCLKRGYHGTYYGSGTASHMLDGKEDFAPNLPGIHHIEAPYCYRCPYGKETPGCGAACAEELDRLIRRQQGGQQGGQQERIAAFIMEPIQGSGGIIVPPKEYFDRIEAICKEHDIFFVLDEVATGFGRTGEMFAADLFDLRPDVQVLSKSINSGYLPLGATMFSERLFKPFWDNDIGLQFGSTQDGNPACCAAALATIEILTEDGVLDNCKKMGQKLKQGCIEIMEKSAHVGDVRGEGMMLGLELVKNKQDRTPLEPQHIKFTIDFLREQGLLVYPNPCGFSMFPPLNVTEEETGDIQSILSKVLTQLKLGG